MMCDSAKCRGLRGKGTGSVSVSNEASLRTQEHSLVPIMLGAIGICHLDDPNLTWREVQVPAFVPVLLNFDEGNVVGRARLTEIPADHGIGYAVKAEIVFDEELFNLPDPPTMNCYVEGATDRTFDWKEEVAFIRGGYVKNISVLTERVEAELFDQEEWDL